MITPPFKTVRKVVEFEALGKVFKSYCEVDTSDDHITSVLLSITPTAHIVSISTDLIEDSIYNDRYIDKIIALANKIKEYEAEQTEIPTDVTK